MQFSKPISTRTSSHGTEKPQNWPNVAKTPPIGGHQAVLRSASRANTQEWSASVDCAPANG